MANTTIVFKEEKKRRNWLRALGWVVGLFLVLIVAAYFVLTSPAFIKSVVLPRVGKALHAKVTVSDVSLSPLNQIVLHDLKVQVPGQTPVLTLAEATVRYHLWQILGGNIHVDEITLDSPRIDVVENPDGSSNLKPLLQALSAKPAQAGPPKTKASKTARIDLGKLALRNASIVEIKNYGGGRSNVLALTNLDLTLSNVKNGQSAALQLSSGLRVDENPPGGTNGFLAATLQGNFNVALTTNLQPASASGKAELAVASAGGAFRDFSAFGASLNCDATPMEIKQLDLRFENAGASLGELTVSGPLDLATMDGRLQLALRGVDRRLLNLAGAAHGMDFDSTTLSSTNEITLADSGKTIGATGRFIADKFQVTRAGETTPALDFSADYAVTVDNATETARLHKLILSGTQDGRPLLAARLSQPMNLAWGRNAGGIGNSALDLDVTNLNLAKWRPFLGNTVSGGNVNLQMKLSSQQGGRQLGFKLNSEINDLAARIGSNQTFQATLNLQAQGRASDFKQLHLSAYRLQIIRQNQSLLTASGSAAYNLTDASADTQLALEGSLPGLSAAFPQPGTKISSGTIKLNGRVTQQGNTQTVTGRLRLADFSGRVGNNSFAGFGSAMDLEVSRTPAQIQIQKLNGALTQNGNAGGDFALTGVVETTNKMVQLNARLSDFNQNGLRPFVEPLLAGKQLVSIAVNGNAAVEYAPNHNSVVKSDLQVTNLVVRDPTGEFPATPLAAQLQIDTTLQNQSANIRRFEIGLTPTARARNRIDLQGQVDFSKPKAVQGNLKLTANSLDLTSFYDLFAGGSKTKAVKAVPARPISTAINQEPPPINLPLHNFTVAADIGHLYLHEVVVTNFQTTVQLDRNRVLVKPFALALNGAPVNAAVDLDLGVPGYQYKFAFGADQAPLTPLVDTFMPDRQGQLGGTLTAQMQIAGAGLTGANLKRNLTGQFEVDVTNLNLSVLNVRNPLLKTLINVVAMVPQLLSNPGNAIISLLGQVTGQRGGLMNQLQQAPIQAIIARGDAGRGRINLQSAVVQSAAFKAEAAGAINLAPALTNSTINIPVTVSLSRPIASQLNLAAASSSTAGAYVPLPRFLTMKRTLGNPEAEINKFALAGIAVQSVGNSLIRPGSNSIAAPVGNLLNQLLRQVK